MISKLYPCGDIKHCIKWTSRRHRRHRLPKVGNIRLNRLAINVTIKFHQIIIITATATTTTTIKDTKQPLLKAAVKKQERMSTLFT